MPEQNHTPLKLKHSSESLYDKVEKLTNAWKILVVDDETEVHTITRLILKDLVFENHPVKLLNAYSAEQAKEILASDSDIAVVLLDVVMETESSGLELIEYIRKQLGNASTRIILRTGHPGQAPESQVIFEYDINDYKAKNELTARKLVTSIVSSIRAYKSLKSLEINRRGLQLILENSDSLFNLSSITQFANGILHQLASFLSSEPAGILCLQLPEGESESLYAPEKPMIEDLKVIGALGALDIEHQPNLTENLLIKNAITIAKLALEKQESIFDSGFSALYVDSKVTDGAVAVLYGVSNVSEQDKFLLDIYVSKIALALANVIHYNQYQSANDAARTDALTSLPNRRDYIEQGQKRLENHQKEQKPMVLAVLDIDLFKEINDKHGHDIGDKLLQKFSEFLLHGLKSEDYLARTGGDEFVIILDNTSQENAIQIFNRIITQLKAHSFHLAEELTDLSVSISIGAATDLKGSIDDLFNRADQKLYQAKANGRGQLVI